MKQALEPREPLSIAKDRLRDTRPVGAAVLAQDLRPEPLDDRVADVIVRGEQVMDDLVARDRRSAACPERVERGRLARADATGDRDRDRAGRSGARQGPLRGLFGLGLVRRRHGICFGGRLGVGNLGLRLVSGRLGVGNLGLRLVGGGLGRLHGGLVDLVGRRLVLGLLRLLRSGRRDGTARGKASSESFRSGVVWTDSAPSARGTGTASSSTRLSESESRRRSPSISRIRTLTGSPCETTSRGFSTWWRRARDVHEALDPGRISTNAPKVTTFVTRPSTTSPSP
jgi:hypothetical protein